MDKTQYPPEASQEAVNRVLTGTALAAHATEDTVLLYTPPAPPQPPSGNPTETNVVQWGVKETDTDIALTTAPTTVIVGSVFLIDAEYMTVTDVSNVDNPGVARASYGTAIAAHAAGTQVSIWGTASATQARRTKTKGRNNS